MKNFNQFVKESLSWRYSNPHTQTYSFDTYDELIEDFEEAKKIAESEWDKEEWEKTAVGKQYTEAINKPMGYDVPELFWPEYALADFLFNRSIGEIKLEVEEPIINSIVNKIIDNPETYKELKNSLKFAWKAKIFFEKAFKRLPKDITRSTISGMWDMKIESSKFSFDELEILWSMKTENTSLNVDFWLERYEEWKANGFLKKSPDSTYKKVLTSGQRYLPEALIEDYALLYFTCKQVPKELKTKFNNKVIASMLTKIENEPTLFKPLDELINKKWVVLYHSDYIIPIFKKVLKKLPHLNRSSNIDLWSMKTEKLSSTQSMHVAVLAGDLDALKKVLDSGDVNIHDDNDLALWNSVNNQHFDIFDYLMNNYDFKIEVIMQCLYNATPKKYFLSVYFAIKDRICQHILDTQDPAFAANIIAECGTKKFKAKHPEINRSSNVGMWDFKNKTKG